jgi:hypothetical protein
MEGMMGMLLKGAVKKYLKDRFGNRFTRDEFEVLAEEFKQETTGDEFSALRSADSEERRELIRTIAKRIQARVQKTGSKENKELMKRFMKAREETSTSGRKAAGKKKPSKA